MKYLMPMAALCFIPLSQAATIQVTANAVDDEINGNCSLIEAVRAANTDTAVDGCTAGEALTTTDEYGYSHLVPDTINIPAGRYLFTSGFENGHHALPQITTAMKLVGQGDKSWNTTLERSATSDPFRFIHQDLSGNSVLTVENLHFKNGQSTNGGAIYSTGGLNVFDSTFEGNSAISNRTNEGKAGAIYTRTSGNLVNIERNTFIKNSASVDAGAIYGHYGRQRSESRGLLISGNTFHSNIVLNGTGGRSAISAYSSRGSLAVVSNNTIYTRQVNDVIPNNSSWGSHTRGNLIDRGLLGLCEQDYNLMSGLCLDVRTGHFEFFWDMGLQPLADNGGKTKTMALTFFSPAIASREVSRRGACLTSDQNGYSGGSCAFGSVRYDSSDDIRVSRRFIYGMQEPRVAFYDQHGAILELDEFRGKHVDVVWRELISYSTGSYYSSTCKGVYSGSFGWMDTNHDYVFLSKRESEFPMPSYACPIWLKPRP